MVFAYPSLFSGRECCQRTLCIISRFRPWISLPQQPLRPGVSLPTDRVYDGINLLPYLTGQQVSPQRTLFWRWFGLGPSGPWGSHSTIYAVRSGDLKLAVPLQGITPVRLFNLANDIGETTDLSKSQPSDVASLQQSWNQWNAQMIEPLWTLA